MGHGHGGDLISLNEPWVYSFPLISQSPIEYFKSLRELHSASFAFLSIQREVTPLSLMSFRPGSNSLGQSYSEILESLNHLKNLLLMFQLKNL